MRTLRLKISGTSRTVGTASAKGSVTVLGQVKSFRIYLENMPNPYYIHPYVVKDLAHCVNLGQAFLRRNSIDFRYREAGVEVSHKGHSASLTSYNKSQYLGAVVNSVQLTLTQNSKVCFI